MTARMPLPFRPGFYNYGETETVGVARVAFRYGPWELAAGTTDSVVLHMEGLTPVEVHRSAKLEKAALNQLRLASFLPAPKVRGGVPAANPQGIAVKDFLNNFNNGTYDGYITANHFVKLPAAWNSAIAAAFLGSSGTLAINDASVCANIGRP